MKARLPVKAAKDLAKEYGLDQVILIARTHDDEAVHFVTYGKTKNDCGMAAVDGRKLRAVIEAAPTSFADAVEAAKRVRPEDVND